MEKSYLITLSATDLETLVFSCVDQAIKLNVKAEKEREQAERLYAPAEACKLFNPPISISTLNRWEKQGLVKKHSIGGRTFYKYGEILAAATTLEKFKH